MPYPAGFLIGSPKYKPSFRVLNVRGQKNWPNVIRAFVVKELYPLHICFSRNHWRVSPEIAELPDSFFFERLPTISKINEYKKKKLPEQATQAPKIQNFYVKR